MKKGINLLVFATCASIMFFGCKKDDPKKKEDPAVNYSSEQHKQKIEENMIAFLQETKALKDLQVAASSDHLVSLMSSAEPKSELKKLDLIYMLASLNDGTSGANVSKYLKAGAESEPSFLDDFNAEIAGVYTWNAEIQDFDKTEATNQIKIYFPGSTTSTSNNCEIAVSIQSVTVNGDITGVTELPSSVNFTYKINNSTAASYSFTASYDAKGIPANVSSILTIEQFKWQVEAAKTSTTASYDFTYSKGQSTLMAYGVSAGGNFNVSEIETFINETNFDDYVEGTLTDAGNYLQNVQSYYQVMDIKITATGNTKELAKALDPIVKDVNNDVISEDEGVSKMVTKLNSNVTLSAKYLSNNVQIASGEFYSKTVIDTYEEFNYETYQYVTVTEEYKTPAIRLVFADGSKIDIESYFSTGMDNLEAEVSALMEEMSSSFENI